MQTHNIIFVTNGTSATISLDSDHLHIEHYNSPARQDIERELGSISSGQTKAVEIVADTSAAASTVTMSFHMPGKGDDAVRFHLKQQGTTAVKVDKNQLGIPAGCYVQGPLVYLWLENREGAK